MKNKNLGILLAKYKQSKCINNIALGIKVFRILWENSKEVTEGWKLKIFKNIKNYLLKLQNFKKKKLKFLNDFLIISILNIINLLNEIYFKVEGLSNGYSTNTALQIRK